MYELLFKLGVPDSQTPIDMRLELKEKEYKILAGGNSKFITKIGDGRIEINSGFFSSDSVVEDEVQYSITVKNNGNNTPTITPKKIDKMVDIPGNTIVLLVESPHVDEYCYEKGKLKPKGPARGKTGDGINKCLKEVLEQVDLAIGEYYLLVCNPIQYQTSLGSIHSKKIIKRLKNHIWMSIWKECEVRYNFIKRLYKYTPIKIINACTSELQDKVGIELAQSDYWSMVYRTYHPSTWERYKGNILVEKVSCNYEHRPELDSRR